MENDLSSGAIQIEPVGDTYRGFGSSWFNAKAIAKEDFNRDVQLMNYQNQFSAREAQKNRDFQERLSNSQYQRAVADMKKAGINPVLAFQQLGSASVPQGSQASSGSASRVRQYEDAMGKVVAGLFSLISTAISASVMQGGTP